MPTEHPNAIIDTAPVGGQFDSVAGCIGNVESSRIGLILEQEPTTPQSTPYCDGMRADRGPAIGNVRFDFQRSYGIYGVLVLDQDRNNVFHDQCLPERIITVPSTRIQASIIVEVDHYISTRCNSLRAACSVLPLPDAVGKIRPNP